MIQLVLVLSLSAAALAAPKADPFYGHLGYHHAPLLHHAVVPLCKIVPKTVVVGQRCHAEPDCTTEAVVVGRAITGHEDPVCEDVEHAVPFGYHHAVATVKVTTKHCAPPKPIIEDVTHDVTTCVPKKVCVDVEGTVPETVCGDATEAAVTEE